MSILGDRRRLVLLRAWHEFLRGRGFDSAAALTFFAALSTLPAALLAVSVISLATDRRHAVNALEAVLGVALRDRDRATIHDVLGELVHAGDSVAIAVVALALCLWAVSGYTAAFGRAMNTVYGLQEGRFYPLLRTRMLLVAVPLVALGLVVLVVLLLTPTAVRRIAPDLGGWLVVWDVGKWPVLAVVLVAMIGLLYRFAPNVRFSRARWLGVGTLVSLGVWALLTGLFWLYAALTGNYGHLYGRLGIVLAGLIWGYLSNFAMIVGMQIDAEIVRMRQLSHGEDAVETIRLPVKRTDRQLRLAEHRAFDLANARRIRDAAPDARADADDAGA